MTGMVRVVRTAEMTTSKPYSYDRQYGAFVMNTLVYNNLKSPMNCLSVQYRDEPTTPYEEFMKDMDTLNRLYDSQEQDWLTDEQITLVLKMDEYLSSLGMTEIYPVKKERLMLAKFINADYKSPFEKEL